MRDLLKLLLGVAVLVAASGADLGTPDDTFADSGHPTLAVLFHPATVLGCGWHSNCDGTFGDNPSMGLDWNPCTSCSPYTWLRIRVVETGGTGLAALGTAYNTPYLGCQHARLTDIKRQADGAVFGQVVNLHTEGTSDQYVNLRGGDNEAVIGTMMPFGSDPCASWVHTMQWYVSGPFDTGWTQNVNGFPTEQGCYHCDTSYNPWSTMEYNFTFIS